MKVGIVGVGTVGTATALALMHGCLPIWVLKAGSRAIREPAKGEGRARFTNNWIVQA